MNRHHSHHHHHHIKETLFGYRGTNVVYPIPRTWHPHAFDINPPKRPTSHLISDILGFAAAESTALLDDTASSDTTSSKPDSRPPSADSCCTQIPSGTQDLLDVGTCGRGSTAAVTGGGQGLWSRSAVSESGWRLQSCTADVTSSSRSADGSVVYGSRTANGVDRSPDGQWSLEGLFLDGSRDSITSTAHEGCPHEYKDASGNDHCVRILPTGKHGFRTT